MIVIDAGHGGSDKGASGNGMFESDYTLLISKYMKDRFDELGIPATLTRSSDETLTPTDRVNRILNAYGNNPSVLVISNHLNAGGGEGSEVIYALRNNDRLAKSILDGLSSAGQPVRKVYQRRLPNDPTKDYYFIHRNTGSTEPLIIEYGFIDNQNDANRIKNNYKKYAEEVVKTIADYKGFTYTPPRVSEEYIVQRGDTLWNISKKLDTTVDELKKLNNLNSNLLFVGQVLKVPSYESATDTNVTYIVKKGDTLYSIASRFNTTVNSLKELNNLKSDSLSIGQSIIIPETTSVITPSEDEIINEGSVYVVEKGDTLYSIAKKFNTTVDKIKNTNSIVNDILTIGMNLLIPTNGNTLEDIIIHTVESGDSLWSLANKYNTTVNDIKQLNNLLSDLLIVGQKLQVKRNTK
ncbi:MAG: LysM peptidoglycan-binding domain-containing protein [Bacilli bacterium]|nr:LysM peptidoglycan-binding domain-containing protein [Bacilli bacterium]